MKDKFKSVADAIKANREQIAHKLLLAGSVTLGMIIAGGVATLFKDSEQPVDPFAPDYANPDDVISFNIPDNPYDVQ